MNVNPTHSERPLKSSRSVKAVIRKSILPHFWLSLVGVIFLLPFIWLVLTSLKSPEEMFAIPVKWLPSKPQWDNYIKIFQTVPFFLYIRNTLFLIVVNIIGTIISAPLVAYSITKVDWKGRNLVFMLIMAYDHFAAASNNDSDLYHLLAIGLGQHVFTAHSGCVFWWCI